MQGLRRGQGQDRGNDRRGNSDQLLLCMRNGSFPSILIDIVHEARQATSQLGEPSGGRRVRPGSVDKGQLPNHRGDWSRHDRSELLGHEGHGLGDESGASSREHEGEDGIALGRHDGELRLEAHPGQAFVEKASGGVPSGAATKAVSSKSFSWIAFASFVGVRGGSMKTRTCGPRPVASSESGTSKASVRPSSALPRLDEVEEFTAVLGSGEIHADPWVLTAKPAHQPRHGVGGERREAGRDSAPETRPATAATAARPVSRSCNACRAGPRSADPASVSCTRRPILSKSLTPRSASTSFTAKDSAGCETNTALEAAVNPP